MNLENDLTLLSLHRKSLAWLVLIPLSLLIPMLVKVSTNWIPDTVLTFYAAHFIGTVGLVSEMGFLQWWNSHFRNKENIILTTFINDLGYSLVDLDKGLYSKDNKQYKLTVEYQRTIARKVKKISLTEIPVPEIIFST